MDNQAIKHRNGSKVGRLISMTQEKGVRELSYDEYNKQAMRERYLLDKEHYKRRAKERETSEFNRTQFKL